MSEARYEKRKVRCADGIKRQRKDQELDRRVRAEWLAIESFKFTDMERYASEKVKYQFRTSKRELREKSWTQEQFEGAVRADAANSE